LTCSKTHRSTIRKAIEKVASGASLRNTFETQRHHIITDVLNIDLVVKL
jgi:hypothetical protein